MSKLAGSPLGVGVGERTRTFRNDLASVLVGHVLATDGDLTGGTATELHTGGPLDGLSHVRATTAFDAGNGVTGFLVVAKEVATAVDQEREYTIRGEALAFVQKNAGALVIGERLGITAGNAWLDADAGINEICYAVLLEPLAAANPAVLARVLLVNADGGFPPSQMG